MWNFYYSIIITTKVLYWLILNLNLIKVKIFYVELVHFVFAHKEIHNWRNFQLFAVQIFIGVFSYLNSEHNLNWTIHSEIITKNLSFHRMKSFMYFFLVPEEELSNARTLYTEYTTSKFWVSQLYFFLFNGVFDCRLQWIFIISYDWNFFMFVETLQFYVLDFMEGYSYYWYKHVKLPM